MTRMAGATMRPRSASLMVLLSALVAVGSWILPTAARADAPGRCYPPPCSLAPPGAVAEGITVGSQPVVLVAPSETRPAGESPVPDVVIGLAAVVTSLSVIALRRRTLMARRTAPEPEPAAPRPSQVRRGQRVFLG